MKTASKPKGAAMSAEEIKRLALSARQKGLLRCPGDKAPAMPAARPVKAEGVTVEWVKITPELARLWLEKNPSNRKLRTSTVTAYARDMKQGNWLATHQGIAFNTRDELIDGQHRLHAVIEAGVEVTMLVTRGLPTRPEGKTITTMDAVDRGAVRHVADQLQIQHGYKNATLVAASAVVIAQICRAPQKLARVTVGQVLGVLAVYDDHIAWTMRHGLKLGNITTGCVFGSIAFARAAAKEAAEDFHYRLMTGENLSAKNPVLHLRNFLLTARAKEAVGGNNHERLHCTDRVLFAVWQFMEKAAVERLASNDQGRRFFIEAQAGNVAKIQRLFDL